MEQNYNNYITTQKLLSLFPINNKERYEYSNIIERFLLNRANIRGIQQTFSPVTDDDLDIIYKMNNELKDKKIFISLEQFKNIFLEPPPDRYIQDECILTDLYISYKDYKYKVDDRIRLLLKMGTKEQVMAMLLRYASMISGGQQWGIPLSKAKELYEQGYRYEGFASPLNSNLLPLGGKYCSLFPDTDVPFGSLGAFDYEKIIKNQDGNWIINPPFTEYLLQYAVVEILKASNKVSSTIDIYMIAPEWKDATFYEILLNTPITQKITQLKKNSYCYEHGGITILAKFNSVEFNLRICHDQ